jgi:hypothetical protein
MCLIKFYSFGAGQSYALHKDFAVPDQVKPSLHNRSSSQHTPRASQAICGTITTLRCKIDK